MLVLQLAQFYFCSNILFAPSVYSPNKNPELARQSGMKVIFMLCVMTVSLLPLLLAGCSADGELTEWAAGKANDALEIVGSGVQEVLDDLHDAEYQGGPFENNLDSARAYLLGQMQEKYGIEFTVVGDEDLENYGPIAGDRRRSCGQGTGGL